MIDRGINVLMAFYEDAGKVVLPLLIARALELQDLAVFEVRIDHIQSFGLARMQILEAHAALYHRERSLCLRLFVIRSHRLSRREYCLAKLSLRRRENSLTIPSPLFSFQSDRTGFIKPITTVKFDILLFIGTFSLNHSIKYQWRIEHEI